MSEPVAFNPCLTEECKTRCDSYGVYCEDICIKEIERKDAAIAELKAENRALSNRAIDCEMSWTHERAERAEMAIAELRSALKLALKALPFSTHPDAFEAVQIAEKLIKADQ